MNAPNPILAEQAADAAWSAYQHDVAEAEVLAGKLQHVLDRAKSHGLVAVQSGPGGRWEYIEDVEHVLAALANLARPERVDIPGVL